MSTYRGTVVLLPDIGGEFTIEAHLTKDSSESWVGVLLIPAAIKTPELLNMTGGTLQVADRSGRFIRTDTSDWIGSSPGRLQFRIEGNEEAPF